MMRAILITLIAMFSVVASAQNTPQIVYTGYPLYAKAITPHDTNPLTDWNSKATAQYVYVGGAGDVACLPAGNPAGQPITFSALTAGSIVPVSCRLVLSTGTSATGLIGLF